MPRTRSSWGEPHIQARPPHNFFLNYIKKIMTPQIVYKVLNDVHILFLTELIIACTAMALVRVVSLSRLTFSERVKPSCNIDTP
jgi:hypothetical protein